MSDTSAIRDALGGYVEKKNQGDNSALRSALNDLKYTVKQNVYATPYPSTPAPAAPTNPTQPTTPTMPTNTAGAVQLPASATGAPTVKYAPQTEQPQDFWQSLEQKTDAGIESVAGMMGTDTSNPFARVGGFLMGAGQQALGAAGDLANTVGQGLDWAEEQSLRAQQSIRGEDTTAPLPPSYIAPSAALGNIAGAYNEGLQQPLAGLGGKAIGAVGAALFPNAANVESRFTEPNPDAQQNINNTFDALGRGDLAGALDGALRTFQTYGNQQYKDIEKIDPLGALAAALIIDPLNFVPGFGVGKMQKAGKLAEITQDIGRIENIAELAPKGFMGKVATPAAKVTEVVKSALQNIGLRTQYADNAEDFFATHRAFLKAGQDAKGFDEIVKTYAAMKSIPAQRAQYLIQGMGKHVDEVENAYKIVRDVVNGGGELADTSKLPKAFRDFLDDAAEMGLTEADLLEKTKAEMASRTSKYFAEQGAKLFPVKGMAAPVKIADRFMNELRGFESLVFIGLSPMTFARNVINGITTMAIEGVNPIWDAGREIARLKKIGQGGRAMELERAIKFQEEMMGVGRNVREAMGLGTVGTGQTGYFGNFMSKMIKGTPVGKPLQWYARMENAMRAHVWSQTYYRALQHNWDVGKFIPEMDAVTQAVLHQYRVDPQQIMGIVREAGSHDKKAVAAEVLKYLRGQRGTALDLNQLAAEMGITKRQLQSFLDEKDMAKAQGIAQEISARVANGMHPAQAANDVIGQAARETAESVAERTGQTLEDVAPVADEMGATLEELEARRGDLVQQWATASASRGGRKLADDLAAQIDAVEREMERLGFEAGQEPTGKIFENVSQETRNVMGLDDVPPQAAQAAPVPAQGIDEAAQVAQEAGTIPLPDELRGTQYADEWASMTDEQRKFAIGKTRADAEGYRPAEMEVRPQVADTYQGAGDVPTLMPDVTNTPPPAPAFGDVLQSAIDKGKTSVGKQGTVVEKPLLAALNKHGGFTIYDEAGKVAGHKPGAFKTMQDVKARTAEAMRILDDMPAKVPPAQRLEVQKAVDELKKLIDPEEIKRQEIEWLRQKNAPPSAGDMANMPPPKTPPSVPPAAPTTITGKLEQAAKTPRHELPTQLSQNVADAATHLKFELKQGEAGKRISYYNQEEGGRVFMAQGSTNPQWYSQLSEKYKTNKIALEAAINKIIKDKGSDTGVTVERVKQIILKQLADGMETMAGKMLPDWEARALLGYPQKDIDEAFDLWQKTLGEADEVTDVGRNAAAQFGDVAKPQAGQGQMFTQGEDTPLFSGAPMQAKESAFKPKEIDATQGKMFSTAPEFGGKKNVTKPIAEIPTAKAEPSAPKTADERWAEMNARWDAEAAQRVADNPQLFPPTDNALIKAFQEKLANMNGSDVMWISNTAADFAGDSNRALRIKMIGAMTGKEPLKSKAGVGVLESAYKEWISKQKTLGRIADDIPAGQAFNEQALYGEIEKQINAIEEIERLRRVAAEDADAVRILSRDEMLKSKARTQADMYDALMRMYSSEGAQRVRVGTDAENRVMGWLRRDVFNGMDESRAAAQVAADWMDNAVMISRDGETHFDAALNWLSPFQFWGTRYAIQSARRVADKPARLAWYLKLRDAQDEVENDPRFPKRLRGMMEMPFPGVPNWASGRMWFAPLETATSIESVFKLNQFQDQLTDSDVAQTIRAFVESGSVSPQEAANAIANKSGALWDSTKAQMEDMTKSTEGLDSITNVFKPHLPWDIIWKLRTGDAANIGVMFPMTRIIRNLTSALPKGNPLNPTGTGINIEQPLKAGLRALTGNQNIPDWDAWEQYRVDRTLADMVGDGTITERDALLAMIERRGGWYDEALTRAQNQMRGQNFTSVFGGQMFPEGEREYYRARVERDQLIDQTVAQLGGNPAEMSYGEKMDVIRANGLNKRGTPLGDFYTKNPVLASRQDAYNEPEGRLKGFLTDELWQKYMALSALDKRMARQGNKELADFITNPERNYDAVTLEKAAGWVKYLRGYLPEAEQTPKVGALNQISFAPPDQSARYQNILDTQGQMFDLEAMQPKLDAYQKMTPTEKRTFRAVNPDVDAYFKWYGSQMKANPDIDKLIHPDTQNAYASAYSQQSTNNYLTSQLVKNLNRMVGKLDDSRARRFNPKGRGTPDKPRPLSRAAVMAIQQKRTDPNYYFPRNVYRELIAAFKASGLRMSFEQWLQMMAMQGAM